MENKYKIINASSIDPIVLGMNKVHPQSKFSNGADYNQIATEYLDICVMELLENLGVDNNISQVSLTSIRSKFNYQYNKNKYWWNYLVTNYPLWLEIQKGYNVGSANKQLTQIKCMVSVEDLIRYRLQSDFGDYFRSAIQTEGKVYTEIDVQSLTNYQAVCAEQKQYKKVAKCQNILDQQQAGILISNAEIKQNVFGQSRMYMNGPNNMMTMNSTVREAALGKCYKYDINCSVFSYMMDVIKTDYPNVGLPCMMGLVESKSYWRKILATECLKNTKSSPEHKLTLIKGSLTALSFGSNPNSWSSGIAEYIYDREDRERFAEHPFVSGLLREIKQYQTIIRSLFPKSEYQGIKLVTLCSNHYQSMEAYAMKNVMTHADADVMLMVHDCIYTKRPIDLVYATVLLQDVIGPYANFECKKIPAWQDRSRWDQNAQAEADHKHRIYTEELLARNQYEY